VQAVTGVVQRDAGTVKLEGDGEQGITRQGHDGIAGEAGELGPVGNREVGPQVLSFGVDRIQWC